MPKRNVEHRFDQKDAFVGAKGAKPLPRSVTRRVPFKLLDGEWRFALDPENRGLEERWYLEHQYPQTAQFPGLLESHLASLKTAKESGREVSPPWTDKVVAWYEREFSVPDNWCDLPDCLTQLTFGACGYETRVWLNGQQLKTIEGEAVHFGEYTSFSYELPPELLKPVNRLTVRVADTMDAEIPRGKQASHVYKRGGIWYQTISGAVRSVWLEPVGRNRLRSRLRVSSCPEEKIVEFDFTTRIQEPGKYRLRLEITAHDEPSAKPLAEREFELPLEAGERLQRVAVEIPDAKIWSPAAPNLYRLHAELVQPNGKVSGIETHFGLRRIEARGRRIYLNGEPVYLDGILYQPGVSTFEEMRRHLLAVKRLGCNLARVHIAGIDPRVYDLADEIGLLLWIEVPSPHSSTHKSRLNHWAELQRMLVFAAAHPSVVIWSLYNEDWGAEDIETNPETRRYISETFDYMRLNYPQILVVDNDGWNHVSRDGRLASHLLTAHIYTPDIAGWNAALDRLVAGETSNVAAEPLVVGDPYFYGGQTPLVVSEWGGFGFPAYGGPAEAEEKARRIREFKRELRKRPIAGDVYTQATSIEEETNGIVDRATGELLVPPGLLGSHVLAD